MERQVEVQHRQRRRATQVEGAGHQQLGRGRLHEETQVQQHRMLKWGGLLPLGMEIQGAVLHLHQLDMERLHEQGYLQLDKAMLHEEGYLLPGKVTLHEQGWLRFDREIQDAARSGLLCTGKQHDEYQHLGERTHSCCQSRVR